MKFEKLKRAATKICSFGHHFCPLGYALHFNFTLTNNDNPLPRTGAGKGKTKAYRCRVAIEAEVLT